MPQIGMSITMETAFRGGTQPFSNVFHYRAAGPGPITQEAYNILVDEVVGILKQLTSTIVTFKYARCWTSGGTPAANAMQFEKQLSGTGVNVLNGSMDKERAFLFQWPAGRSRTGKPVYLRKWIHSCGACAGYNPSADVLQNTSAIPQASRDAIAVEANKLRIIGPVDEWLLVAASGREHTGPGTVHKYLEHHQLGDQWR